MIREKLDAIRQRYHELPVVSKASLWFLACNIIQKSFSLLTTPIFTRLMTRTQYGVYGIYISWMQILAIPIVFRLDYAVFNKGMVNFKRERDAYASGMLGFVTVTTTAALVLYLLFRAQVNAVTELSTPIMLSALAELYGATAISFWSLREKYEFRYKGIVFVTLLTAALNAGLGILAVTQFEDKATARVLSCAISQVAVGAVIAFILFRKGKTFWNRTYVRFAIRINIPLLPYYFSTYIVEQSDRIMVQKLISMEAEALYNAAYTLGGIIKIVSGAISGALIPAQYRQLEKGEYDAVRRGLLRFLTLMAAVSIGFICIAPELIWALCGEKYREAVSVIPPVSASVFFVAMFTILTNIELFYDKKHFSSEIAIVAAVLNLVLNILFIPRMGYVAAAYTTLVSYMLYAAGHIFYAGRTLSAKTGSNPIPVRQLVLLGGGVLLGCVASRVLYQMTVVRYAVAALLLVLLIVKRKQITAFLK